MCIVSDNSILWRENSERETTSPTFTNTHTEVSLLKHSILNIKKKNQPKYKYILIVFKEARFPISLSSLSRAPNYLLYIRHTID